MYLCRRQQLKDSSSLSSSRLHTESVSSTSSRDSPNDVISRCYAAAAGDVTPCRESQTDDVTMTSQVSPTLHCGTVPPPPPTILMTCGTVPEALDYRSMLVGAALARQEMMTSLNDYTHRQQNLSIGRPYLQQQQRGVSRRFAPYVITNEFVAGGF